MTSRRLGLALLTAAATGAGGQAAVHSPPPTRIDGRPSCATCRIVVEERLTLTTPDTVPSPGANTTVVVDSRGRFLFPSEDGTRILIFDRNGKFVRSFGRPGSGPGEFRKAIAVVIAPGDSILIVDQPRAVHVYTADLMWVRDTPGGISSYGGVLPLADGSLVHFAHAFRVVSATGAALRTFGETDRPPSAPPTCRGCGDEHFAGASATSLWASFGNRYLLEEWTTAGVLTRVLEVDSPWFKPWMANNDALSGTQPRQPYLAGVRVESPNLIWVAGIHAPANWKPVTMPNDGSIRAVKTEFGTAISGDRPALMAWMFELGKNVETVLEVIDLAAQRVVVSQRLAGSVALINPTTASQLVETSDGNLVFKIFSLKRTQ